VILKMDAHIHHLEDFSERQLGLASGHFRLAV
jgi:hypothetical protein